jgi:Galactose oxidase, central domain
MERRRQGTILPLVFIGLVACAACGGGNVGNNGGGNVGNNGGGGAGGAGSQVAIHFSLMVPTTVSPSTFFSVNLVALDASNKTVASYSGTVHFTSSDPQAVLPGDSSLNNGTGTFSASLTSLGSQTITATDTLTTTITGHSSSIAVATNPNAHGFYATGDMGTQRAGHTATLLQNGKVLIAGGYNNSEVLATAELFDPTTGTFTPTGIMTTPRFSQTATLLQNGKVLIAGGSPSLADLSGGDDTDDLSTAELFDPTTETFTATGSMSNQRSQHAAALLANGKVLLAGGAVGNAAELFDPATGLFTAAGNLIVGGRWGCTATLLHDGTVLLAGGRDDENFWAGLPLNNAELFNPTTGTFTATGSMTEFRFDHAAALLNNGQVLLTGGFNGSPVSDAELFDPTTGSFSRTGSMGTARARHTAALLNDGTVIVAGGFSYNAPGSFSSAEVFDPTTNQFTPTGPMAAPRFSHTATQLGKGQVLVTGGQSNITIPVVYASSADIYR